MDYLAPPPLSPARRGEQDACDLLEEKAAMLKEYFMLQLSSAQNPEAETTEQEKGQAKDDARGNNISSGSGKKSKKILRIFSLPVLLEGHSPVPEGLPMFLFRLATEVGIHFDGIDWLRRVLRYALYRLPKQLWSVPNFAFFCFFNEERGLP